MLSLVGKDRLAVHHDVQHPGSREPHRGCDAEILLDFPLEASRLEQDGQSGKTTLDLDVHDSSLASSGQTTGLVRPMTWGEDLPNGPKSHAQVSIA